MFEPMYDTNDRKDLLVVPDFIDAADVFLTLTS